ncbi:MAG: hypothetical protein V4593_01875 [Pseudomonadota bacterium]
MPIKFYGYSASTPSEEQPTVLSEVTLSASPSELRSIAEFLVQSAAAMEERGTAWEHAHLRDSLPGFDDSPDFVLFNPQARNLT